MPDKIVTVVISQGQSRAPDKRQLETDIANAAAGLDRVRVMVIPHLYDLPRDGESYKHLRAIDGPMIVCAWLFDRATHWVLDRNGVCGQTGQTLLKSTDDDDEDELDDTTSTGEEASDDSERVTSTFPRPERNIYCLDLRDSSSAQEFQQEIRRIAELELNEPVLSATTMPAASMTATEPVLPSLVNITAIDEHPSRRWYPVIDFSRCTNCMECIDFCLFGVYGVDSVETILVEQPDNCRKGCPACSRVCPANAIIFPQHKTPAIAGAPADAGGFKIDLSKLFGAPDEGADALEVAARERDEQLILAGRQAVGLTEDLQARLNQASDQPQDHLDKLIDQLDELEL